MFDRELVFDPPSNADPELVRNAISILDSNSRDSKVIPYRGLFREVTRDQVKALLSPPTSFCGFGVSGYFEDQHQKPVDEVDVIAILSGDPKPVILGNPRSVVQLGPSGMIDKSSWKVQDVNDVAHLIQTVTVLQRGRWWSQGASMVTSGDDNNMYSLKNPDLDSITAALALLRQFLLKRDDVFRVATTTYMNHVEDVRKREWVRVERASFEQYLKSRPRFVPDNSSTEFTSMTNEDLIETVVYGSGLFHRQSNSNLEDRLMKLYMGWPREQLVFSFHMTCREMLRAPFTVAPVMYQDLSHWIHSDWSPKPTRMVISRLFADT